MGEELPLAWREEERQPMLLAITGSGESITTSSNRNQRTQEIVTPEVSNGGATEDTETKSQGSRKAERADARYSRPARHRRDNKNRKSDRGDEGEYKLSRRGSEVMGVRL
ncbi:hypothetical protein LCGC14_2903080 [marine sediment metagenome]|uniref:Uncharacterized protein n=1 Tax=marine sediment metagenome TaxID=412755 RepID=A0A0F8XTT3_9ZZZZ